MRKLIPQRRMPLRATSSVTGFRVWLLADESAANYPCAYEDAAVSPGGAALAAASTRRGFRRGPGPGDVDAFRAVLRAIASARMRCAPFVGAKPAKLAPAKCRGIPGQEVFPVTRIVPLPAATIAGARRGGK